MEPRVENVQSGKQLAVNVHMLGTEWSDTIVYPRRPMVNARDGRIVVFQSNWLWLSVKEILRHVYESH